MKGGSAQARTRRSDTSMKESKTDPPKKKVGEEECQIVLNKMIVKTNIPGESVGINAGFEQRGCREKMSWE